MNHKYSIILLLFLFSFGCSENSRQDEAVIFPEKTDFTESIFESLGNDLSISRRNNFILISKNDSYSAGHQDSLIVMIEDAVERVTGILNSGSVREGIYLFMVDSREQMESLIGRNVKAIASGRNNTAVFVYNAEIRPYFNHELFHLIAHQLWGEPKSRLLDEGGAMYSDNNCLHYDNPLSTVNKYLHENKMWFKIDEIVDDFSAKAAENDLIAYLQAGFVFRYLYNNYSIEKITELWQTGFSNFEKIYGFGIDKLDNKIKQELRGIELERVDWIELMQRGCG